MPDLSQVEQAIAQACAAALSTSQIPHRVHRGWPIRARLDEDLKNNVVTVSVYPMPGATRNTTKYRPKAKYDEASKPVTVSAEVVGNTVRILGSPDPSNVVSIGVDEVAYARRCLVTDTPETIAAGLRQLILPHRPVTILGSVLTFPNPFKLQAVAVADWVARSELRRQEQVISVIIWAPTPELRDEASGLIDIYLTRFRVLPVTDRDATRLTYDRSMSTDEGTESLIYRRDLIYSAEYATVYEAEVPSVSSVTSTIQTATGTVLDINVTVQP